MWTFEVWGEHFSPTRLYYAVKPVPTLSGKRKAAPLLLPLSLDSPGVSASQADFKTGAASPGRAAKTLQRGSKSAPAV